MSYPLFVSFSAPSCSGWLKISSIRLHWIFLIIMTALKLSNAAISGSYTRETRIRKAKNVSSVIFPSANSTPPASTVVAMPSFSTMRPQVWNTALVSSPITVYFSTSFIFLSSPFKYSSSALFAFRSRSVSRHSWMPSEHAMDTSVTFSCRTRIIPADASIIPKETGSTHSEASAMRQSKAKSPAAIKRVEISEPINSGTQWDNPPSNVAQSAISTVVRSDRSFFPKKDRGIFRSFSARESLRTPLST